MSTDSRYPYTYAADYLRQFGGFDSSGVKMSRSDASQVRTAVAKAIGISDEDLAKKLADYYKSNQEDLDNAAAMRVLVAFGVAQ